MSVTAVYTRTAVFPSTPRALILQKLTFPAGQWCHWSAYRASSERRAVVVGSWWYPGMVGCGHGADLGWYPWYGSGPSSPLHFPLYLHCGYCTTPLYPTVATAPPHCTPLWLPLYLHCGSHCTSTVVLLASVVVFLASVVVSLASLVVSPWPHWWFHGLTGGFPA